MNSFNKVLEFLSTENGQKALANNKRGIEREALRITPDAQLAMDSHPKALGHPLTHSRITTDYSEALLEFITPVSTDIEQLLTGLTETHAYAIKHLNGQKLWSVSMPCYLDDESAIPVARFGNSNAGKMKTLYRTGLTHRYGALMQIIAGVHFNFSVSNELWDLLYSQSNKQLSQQDFISDSYFGLIRNYRRLMWILPYLFGASPAICSSFAKHSSTDFDFETLDNKTLFLPWATSLRMSDLGYTNQEQEKLNISYNSLTDYLRDIRSAIKMPSHAFEKIGVKVGDTYRQLNSNILQIENEFYAPIRAKRVTRKGEKPSDALADRGVEYIEVRALDVNPFSPIGIDKSQVYFLDLLLLYCLLTPSNKTTLQQDDEITDNFKKVVIEGRKPDLALTRDGHSLSLKSWLSSVFEDLNAIAVLLDTQNSHHNYQAKLAYWHACIDDPEKTLSGQVMKQTMSHSHGHWALSLSEKYQQYFANYPLSPAVTASFQHEAIDSYEAQSVMESTDSVSFDDYLLNYFST